MVAFLNGFRIKPKLILPIIMGVFLGAISIIMGQVHTAVAQFSGMTVIGHNEGYLLGALIAAWLNWERWAKSFAASFLTLTFANITYYACILVFYFTGWGRSPFPPSPMNTLFSFVLWTVIASIICLLAATAIWMARCAEAKWLNYGIFAVSYAGLLGVVLVFRLRPFIGWYNMTVGRDGFTQTWRVAGFIFEIVLAVVIITVVLGIGFRNRRRGIANAAP